MNATYPNEIKFSITRNGIEIPLTITGDYSGEDYGVVDVDGNDYIEILTHLEWDDVFIALDTWNTARVEDEGR